MALLRLKRAAQITIPAELRKRFNLEEGDYLEAEAVEEGILLKPVTVMEREQARQALRELLANRRAAGQQTVHQLAAAVAIAVPTTDIGNAVDRQPACRRREGKKTTLHRLDGDVALLRQGLLFVCFVVVYPGVRVMSDAIMAVRQDGQWKRTLSLRFQ